MNREQVLQKGGDIGKIGMIRHGITEWNKEVEEGRRDFD